MFIERTVIEMSDIIVSLFVVVHFCFFAFFIDIAIKSGNYNTDRVYRNEIISKEMNIIND